MRVTALGWRADAALRASSGRARVIAALSRSLYAEAAGDLVWLGEPGTPLHPRAVLALDVPMAPVGATVAVDPAGVVPWRPEIVAADAASLRAGARDLHARLASVGVPRGLGRLLTGDGDDALAARARPHATALASACAAGDARGVAVAGRALLGLGPGFTPSGDDYVGGMLFAWRLLGADDAGIAELVADARERTHPISARLLADLAAGEGWAPLHDLAAALGRDGRSATEAARRVVAIGHSSGWDLLAGMLTALLGPEALTAGGPVSMEAPRYEETRPL